MLKFTKIILIAALVSFIVNCTKNKDEVTTNNVDSVKVVDTHDHSRTKGLKDGNLPTDSIACKVASFSMEDKYQEAIDVLVAAKDVPGYQWDKEKIYQSLIYLNDKTKQYEKNLEIWRDGHNKGIIFKMDKTKKHFEPYLVLDGFDEIYEIDLGMQNKAKLNK